MRNGIKRMETVKQNVRSNPSRLNLSDLRSDKANFSEYVKED
jgi:hypothetical protein